jgi:antitoxin component of RelBE/YafQ-DinJ toxin-antitoxin module
MYKNKVPLNVSVSKQIVERIEQEAEKLGMTKSLYVEILLRKIFGLEPLIAGERSGENQ